MQIEHFGLEAAISAADRCRVPLKSACSMKCMIPFLAGVSWRDPVLRKAPKLTDRTCGTRSVITTRLFGSRVLRTSKSEEISVTPCCSSLIVMGQSWIDCV
jgi:hypothetical protein